MDILVFGASGRVGRRICDYASNDGHAVTAFVRDTATAPAGSRVVEGDVTDAEAVAAAVPGHDAVCLAIGPDEGETPTVLSVGVENVLAAMAANGVDRLVTVAAAGILQATPNRLRLDTPEFPDHLRQIATAHHDVYERLQASTVDWTLVCPPQMPEGTPTNHYRTAVDYLPDGGQSVSTGDVAAFLYETLVENRHRRERVGIAY
ncbi:NAD(P)H-binding protein [Halomicroarcula sp. F13]|uniref:NAD(P)H-binding protein n=1 Tax=Haloarcula rubra TaxID=2487747 RepID=A0AAW4PX83_9EURY|nr:NAD(P)H-binding protein [Halomicroarcula rubra]MBX0325946.1 NAD(P)H-binding protein [Halomicroarcula rubra]